MREIKSLYDPKTARSMVEKSAAMIEAFLSNPSTKVRSALSDQDLERMVSASLEHTSHTSQSLDQRAESLLSLYMSGGMNLHSPGYMGHQVPPPLPASGAMDALVSAMNQGLAIAELSPLASATERVLVRKLRNAIGWNDDAAAGICTSGGTLANTTAILAARNRRYPSSWKHGVPKDVHPVLLTSEDSHYSVSRSMGVLGLGTDQLISVPVNNRRRMTGAKLEEILLQQKTLGADVFCVVASAPSTPAGSIDEISQIADVCESHKIWLHLDAVHGAPFLFSETLKSKLDGIERADSVAWDAHKMMYVPSLCTFLLYRNLADSFLAFENRASYLFDESDPEMAVRDGAKRTFECTKRALAAPLWFVWSIYGTETFAQLNEYCVKLAKEFHETLNGTEDFVSPIEPDSNILCFQFRPKDIRTNSTQLNFLQPKLRQKLIESRNFYITQTKLGADQYLRVTLINPLTTKSTLQALMSEIRAIASEISE